MSASDGPALIDTHLLLWWFGALPALTPARVERIERAAILVSDLALWEIMIKRATGRLRVDPDRLLGAIEDSGFRWLPLTRAHILALDALPWRTDHRDPFDRLLIAQATVERIPFLTADRALAVYGPPVELV
jgi:PIN domain nuclease of toxin-antitoxin system